MKKLLYITDHDEYVDHSFIAPLFEVYLKKYMSVDVVYFTAFKSDFSKKDEHHFVVPGCNKRKLFRELKTNGINLESYDFVMVRNSITLLKKVLKYRSTYGYKALFRFSYPKRSVNIYCETAEEKNQFIKQCLHYLQTKKETKLINQCDAFLPTSIKMHETFRPEVNIPTIVCSPAINPEALHKRQQHNHDETRFIYVGTLDKVREFSTILDAFNEIKDKKWKLYISTRDLEFTHDLLSSYPQLQDHIKVYNAKTKDALLELIAKADIGLALLPNIDIYNTSTPVKIFDYYSSALPCIMTHSEHASTLFTDNYDAWFCDFNVHSIKDKLNFLLSLPKEVLTTVGEQGQKRLLEVKNYETIAKNIADQLKAL